MKRKLFLLSALVSIMVLFAVSAYGSSAPSSQSAEMPDFGDTFYTLLTGGTGGTYYPVGIIIANLWNEKMGDKGINVSGQSSAGGIENLNMLKSGEADMCLAVSDYGRNAMSATAMFEGVAQFPELRQLCGLWPELVHLVATDASGIQGVKDIAGKRFSIGAVGAATTYSSAIFMQALAGVAAENGGYTAEYLAYSEASVAMQNGQLDVMNITGGVPTSSVSEIMAGSMDVHIVPFTVEQHKALLDLGHNQFGLYSIPANTYTGQTEDISTIGFKCGMFTTTKMNDETAYWLTKTLFDHFAEIRGNHSALSAITLENNLQGLAAVPLHDGAVRYFEEMGVEIPEHLRAQPAK